MDQSEAPILDGLVDYRKSNRYGFTPPGHRQGRGTDGRVLAVLDVCVVSVHKMGAGFEQGSVFHLQGDLVEAARLSACADLLMTTSPNVMVTRRSTAGAGRWSSTVANYSATLWNWRVACTTTSS
jgi:arginine/lysine/ornithine decarboxylase